MTRKRKLSALVAAAVAVATLAAGCTDDSAKPSPSGAAGGVKSGEALKAALPAMSEHPAGTQILATLPMQEAFARAMPGTGEPSGVVVMPRCISYFSSFGGLETLDGWYQWGMRANGALFIIFVAKAPRPNVVESIRQRVAVCNKGYQTIQGWPPSATDGGETVASVLSFAERKVPDLPGALTFGVLQSITWNNPEQKLTKIIRTAWQCTDGPCKSWDSMVSKDDLFIWVHEGGVEADADKLAKSAYEKAIALK